MKCRIGLLSVMLMLSGFSHSQVFTLTDLGKNFFPTGINNSGQVAGNFLSCNLCQDSAAIWSKANGFKMLPLFPTQVPGRNAGNTGFNFAIGLNNLGDVVGVNNEIDFNGGIANLWPHQGGAVFLGSFDLVDFGVFDQAVAINDVGQITGSSNGIGFLWTATTGLKSLGTLPGHTKSFAVGIDSNGTIAGNSEGPNLEDNGPPWIWTPFNGIQPIPSLPAGAHITAFRNGVAAGYVCDAVCQSS